MSGFTFNNTSTGPFTFGNSSSNTNNTTNNNNNNNNNNNKNNNNNTNTNTNANANFPTCSSFLINGNNNGSLNNNTLNSFNLGNNNKNNNNNNNNNNNKQQTTNAINNSFNFGNNNNTNQNQSTNTFNFANGSNMNNNNSNIYNSNNLNPMLDIKRLYNQYNPSHELCRFQTVLYNKIPSSMNVNLFNNKPPLIRSIIWEQGCKNNPYKKKLVPVGICGYDQLNQRSNLCLAGHCSSVKRFQEISEKINILKNEINIKTKQTITDLKQTQIYLSHRLLIILRAYINKITNTKGNNNNFSIKETKLKNVLQQMCKESKQLINLYGHINKLSYDLDINSREKGYLRNNYINNNTVILNDIQHTNPENMKQMFAFLKQQQQFLQLLSKTVQNDVKDLNIITNGIQTKQNPPPGTMLLNTFNTSSAMLYG